MTSFVKRTWAEIDMNIAAKNYEIISENASGLPVIAVIKADAYGHGATEMAALYEFLGAAILAVSGIDEGIELRNSGIKTQILVFGYTPAQDITKLVEYDLIQTIYCADYAKVLSETAKKADISIKIHIKIDTGMGRLGFDCRSDAAVSTGGAEAAECAKLPGFIMQGLYTHFSSADGECEADIEFTKQQYQRFQKAAETMRQSGVDTGFAHCCNSAGAIAHTDKLMGGVRAGIILYGLSPSDEVDVPQGILPVMQFKSSVTMVKTVSAGEYFSYGRTYMTQGKMRVATVCVGYADGYPRAASGKGRVLIKGEFCKILGRVCMDQIIVDVTPLDDVQIGEEVTLIGRDGELQISANEVASYMDSINYEVVCDVGTRVPRVYLKDGEIIRVINRIIQ